MAQSSKFFIVEASALPEVFLKVAEAKQLLSSGDCQTVGEATRKTGISRSDVTLSHMMDFTYYNQHCIVEVYAGVLKGDVELVSEKHPLCWIDAGEDFFDLERFAGEGNIGHMVEQVRDYGMGVPEK